MWKVVFCVVSMSVLELVDNSGCESMKNLFVFFFKQKTAYEMCGRDWSSDVCSSDLLLDRAKVLRSVRTSSIQSLLIYRLTSKWLTKD